MALFSLSKSRLPQIFIINPDNVLQTKSIIKAALDLLVKTYLLDRSGIVENVPNLSDG